MDLLGGYGIRDGFDQSSPMPEDGSGDGDDADAMYGEGGATRPDGGPRGDWGTADACGAAALGIGFSFAAPKVMAAEHAGQPVAHDFNGDGRIDLAYIGGVQHDSFNVVMGKGDGTFAAPVTYFVLPWGVVGGSPPAYAVDIDADGVVDLLTVSVDGVVSELLGRPNGTFGQANIVYGTRNQGQVIDRGAKLAVGDVNGDRLLDVFVAGTQPTLLLGVGAGTLAVDRAQTNIPPAWVGAAVFADLNQDGKLDLAYSNNSSNYLEILLGNGKGEFQLLPRARNNWGAFESAVIGDLNHDGHLDILAESGGPRGVWFGQGDGNFSEPYTVCSPQFGVGAAATGVSGVESPLADLDGDGNPDVMGFSIGPGNPLAVCRGDSKGWFRGPDEFALAPLAINGIVTFTAGDFNNDCRPDVVMAAGNIGVFLNTTP